MDDTDADSVVAAVASAIAEPNRARMLCCLMDGRARTATELAAVADVSASTASAHLARLTGFELVTVSSQGRHRYHGLADARVAAALEALMVLGNSRRAAFASRTPQPLRHARTCYDHLAGTVAVALHDELFRRRWLQRADGADYRVTGRGAEALADIGVVLDATRTRRRRLACACLDWSERRPHVGGAVGAALLELMLARRWLRRELDGRAVEVTRSGVRALADGFGIDASAKSA